ncbi:MAG TPA: ATP-binding protein [Dissulfurispiraceae bacterium]|nr:ATP-binding protein [Dissulfurispiraceae bacterium]
MIKPTQRKLTVIFTTIIIVFNALVLVISFATLNRSLIRSLKNHLNHDVKDEYLAYVRNGDFKTLEDMREHEYFQVFDKEGRLISGTYGFQFFKLPVNKDLIAQALSGRQKYETVEYNNERYLVSYIPVDSQHTSRVAMPLSAILAYERNFMNLTLLMMPVMLIVSFLVSRYLVNQAMKPIADVFAFQENFSSNVTHELRSPLASLKGNLEVTLRKERSIDDYRETLRLGLREVDRMVDMINNLYMLASSKFRPLDLVKKETNIKPLIEEIIGAHRADILSKKINVDTSAMGEVKCSCDDVLMRRAVENLIDNAVKYTPEGGVISIGLHRDEQRVSLSISNTCECFNRDEMKNFFEPFYRGQNALKRGIDGKGLGLYITRYIVRSHGGDVTMKMKDDNLCTIEITYKTAGSSLLKLI